MILRAFIAIVAADALDRNRREQQLRARAKKGALAAPPCAQARSAVAAGNFDWLHPERPMPDEKHLRTWRESSGEIARP